MLSGPEINLRAIGGCPLREKIRPEGCCGIEICHPWTGAQVLLGHRHREAPLQIRSRASGIRVPKLELGSEK